MEEQAELPVLAAQPVVRLARLVRMASTVTEVRQVMAPTAVRVLKALGEPME